jgi:molybdate transport system substrate-binding protein
MLSQADRIQSLILLLLTSLALFPAMLVADTKPKQEILVAAAASLKDVLEKIGPEFMKEFPEITLTFQFGASGALQQQIERGAPVDVFISAAQSPIEALRKKNLLLKDSVQNLCSNELVLIVPEARPNMQNLQQLKTVEYQRIALGESRTVPAGQYAEAWLQKAALLGALKDKLVPLANVRQVLTLVETGNVDAGFVYASDALISQEVKVVLRAQADMHPAIVYPLALLAKSKQPAAGRSFAQYLKSTSARRILLQYGFKMLPEKLP